MSLIPSFFGTGRSTNFSDPFSHDTRSCSIENTHNHKDWEETPEAFVFKAHLPGLKKEEVKVEIEGRVLHIIGERSKEDEDEIDHARHHRMERSRSGRFLRRFRLPENAKVDEVKAAMENGELIVTFAKEEVKKPVQITG